MCRKGKRRRWRLLTPLQAGLWAAALQEREEGGDRSHRCSQDCALQERDEGGRPPALKAAAADPKGTFTAAAAEAGDGEEPEEAAGDACTSEGGAGGAEEEPGRAAGDACTIGGGTGGAEEEAAGKPGTAMTGDTTGEGCEGEEEEEEPQKYLMTPFVGFTRSGGVESVRTHRIAGGVPLVRWGRP